MLEVVGRELATGDMRSLADTGYVGVALLRAERQIGRVFTPIYGLKETWYSGHTPLYSCTPLREQD